MCRLLLLASCGCGLRRLLLLTGRGCGLRRLLLLTGRGCGLRRLLLLASYRCGLRRLLLLTGRGCGLRRLLLLTGRGCGLRRLLLLTGRGCGLRRLLLLTGRGCGLRRLLLLTGRGCGLRRLLLLTGRGCGLRRLLLLASCGCRLCRLLLLTSRGCRLCSLFRLTSCGCRLRRLLLLASCRCGLFLLRLTRLLLLLPFGVLRTKPGPGIRNCLGAGWPDDLRQCVPRLGGAAWGCSRGHRLRRISRREMRLLLLTSCGCSLFLLRLTGLQLPFRVLRTKPGPGIRNCLGAGWRDDLRQCVRRLLKRHTASPVALRPLQCLIAGSGRAAALARQRGDRRWQSRTNLGSARGQLATLCTRAPRLPITAPGHLRGLQRPRPACLVGDRDGIGRPVSDHSAVQVRKDHVVCNRGLQLRWRTDPHGDRNVNGSREQKRCLRHLWRGKLG